MISPRILHILGRQLSAHLFCSQNIDGAILFPQQIKPARWVSWFLPWYRNSYHESHQVTPFQDLVQSQNRRIVHNTKIMMSIEDHTQLEKHSRTGRTNLSGSPGSGYMPYRGNKVHVKSNMDHISAEMRRANCYV